MYLLFIFIILIFFYLIKNHVRVDAKSFFRKGFAKHDDAFGLYTFCGKQGTGKTYSAVKFCIDEKLKHNYIILTNVKSFDIFDDTIYFDNILDLINFVKSNYKHNQNTKYLVFFDEIFTVLQKGYSFNNEILSFLAQLRKRSIVMITTAQEWSEIPLTFRRFSRFQIDCNMFNIPLIDRAFLVNRLNDGYNCKWSDEAQDFVAPIILTTFSKANKYIIDSYDTFETINNNLKKINK